MNVEKKQTKKTKQNKKGALGNCQKINLKQSF